MWLLFALQVGSPLGPPEKPPAALQERSDLADQRARWSDPFYMAVDLLRVSSMRLGEAAVEPDGAVRGSSSERWGDPGTLADVLV
jgi:hypothetical protein